MPFVNIRITKENGEPTTEQKQELIAGVTDFVGGKIKFPFGKIKLP